MPRSYDKDPYAILGIPLSASASQVKDTYRRLARQYHPDLNKDPRAPERMKDINWANDILGDPVERSHYDLWRRSGIRVEQWPGAKNPPPRNAPPPSSGVPPRNPPPQHTYTTVRQVQNTRMQGCSTVTIIWVVIMLLTNIARSSQSTSQSNPIYYFNAATQTAKSEELDSAIETFIVRQNLPTRAATFPSESLLRTVSAPAATVEVDEFGHENIRSKVVPGTKEWEWINTYFPEYDLTTTDGLSDEVTFVYWDQVQRAIIIETRQSGKFFFFVGFTGQLTVGHTRPGISTPTAISMPSPTP